MNLPKWCLYILSFNVSISTKDYEVSAGVYIIEGPSGKGGYVPFKISILLKTEWLVLAM